MVTLKKSMVERLRKIFKEDFARELTFEEASEIGSTLVGCFDILLKAKLEINENNGKDNATKIL